MDSPCSLPACKMKKKRLPNSWDARIRKMIEDPNTTEDEREFLTLLEEMLANPIDWGEPEGCHKNE